MTEESGHMQSKPLIEECSEAAWESNKNVGYWCDWDDLVNDPDHEMNLSIASAYKKYTMAIIDVLRKRGLINEQGLEIIKRDME